MRVLDELTSVYPSVYFTPAFKLAMENMLPFIRTSPSLQAFAIEPYESAVFEGDFYALLQKYKVPKNEHYLAMRLNGMKNPSDYTGEQMVFLLPPAGFIQRTQALMNVQVM